MNSYKETAKKGLNIIGGIGLMALGTGVLGAVGGTIANNLGGEIQANFFNNTTHLTGIGLVTAATAWGLRRVFVDGPNTKMDGTPKLA